MWTRADVAKEGAYRAILRVVSGDPVHRTPCQRGAELLMAWNEVGSQCTLSISALVTVMARWREQSEDELRETFKPAQAETIEALAAPLTGGVAALPSQCASRPAEGTDAATILL